MIPDHYIDKDSNVASSFVRNLRGWITYAISALLQVASFREHRFILLHLIRSPGIGEWGAYFLQFEKLEKWTEHHVDDFLVMLKLLVWPLEWNSPKAVPATAIDFEWIVVEDDEPRKVTQMWTPKVTEDDYIAVGTPPFPTPFVIKTNLPRFFPS